MLIFVYGDDSFRVREKVREMKKRFVEKFDPSGMNLQEFSDKPQIGEVMQSAQSSGFLAEKRMTIVRDLVVATKKAEAEDWVEGFKKIPKENIVIFWETAEPKKVEAGEIFKSFKKEADVFSYPYPLLEGSALTKWTTDRAKELSLTFESGALQKLVERVGPDLWRMDGELQKLQALCAGTNSTVSNTTIEQTVRATFEDHIFDFVDAVSRKDHKTALRLLEEERLSGASDHHLLSMLTRQVRILLGACSLLAENPRATKDELATSMGIHPFVAQKSLQQAKSFRLEDLQAAHEALFAYDLAMKTGGIEAGLAVDLTVAKFLT